MKKLKNNGESGITIIALVVTVIVLSILIAISFSMLKKDDGAITKSKQTKATTEQAQFLQEAQAAFISYDQQAQKNTPLEYYLNKIGDADVEQITSNLWYVKRGNLGVTISKSGRIVEGKLELWDGTASTGIGGYGTPGEPFLIRNAKDLAFMSNAIANNATYTDKQGNTRQYSYACFKQENDIVLNDISEFERWDDEGFDTSSLNEYTTSNNDFCGGYDGNNNIIYGLYINQPAGNNIGFFRAVRTSDDESIKITDSYVKNLNFENAYVKAGNYLGGIISASAHYTTISNCSVSGKITNVKEYCGGIAGWIRYTNMINCKNFATVEATGKYIGGIAGWGESTGDYKMINNCENFGQISGLNYVAGIIGRTNSWL